MLRLRSILSPPHNSLLRERMLRRRSMAGGEERTFRCAQHDRQVWPTAYFVYITTNPAKIVLYIGVTGSQNRRLTQHYDNRGDTKTFTGRYFCYHLLYAEQFADIASAIAREKELKG